MNKFFLASKSEVKIEGMKSAFSKYKVESSNVDFGSMTATPQPVGHDQALQCCRERLAKATDPTQIRGVLTKRCVVVAESFIEKIETESGEVWVDKTMVIMGNGTSLTTIVGPPLGVRIPGAFQPPLDTESLDYTVGSRIHEAHPDVPADDWYQFAGYPFSRAQVIAQTLKQCRNKMRADREETSETNKLFFYMEKNPMKVYPNFPKPNVDFADLFSLTLAPKFNKLFCDASSSYINANFTASELKSTCVVGLESRGLMLGYSIAAASNLAFVPARKPGKLAGEIDREEYEKEYGIDVLEMSKEQTEGFENVIIVDDVIATGGSMLAACNLCERLGLSVVLILALDDIEPLRREWQQKLWPYKFRILGRPTRSMNPLAIKQ